MVYQSAFHGTFGRDLGDTEAQISGTGTLAMSQVHQVHWRKCTQVQKKNLEGQKKLMRIKTLKFNFKITLHYITGTVETKKKKKRRRLFQFFLIIVYYLPASRPIASHSRAWLKSCTHAPFMFREHSLWIGYTLKLVLSSTYC